MTNKQIWLLQQSCEYLKGYDSACACEPLDKTRSADFQSGWLQATIDNEHGA